MANERESMTDRFARWARMGNNERETTEMAGMDEQGVSTAVEDSLDNATVDTQSAAGRETASATAEAQQLVAEADQLRAERDAYRDRLARLQAEFDNARKREAKERTDARDRGIEAAVEPFLGVMDNFALARKAEGSVEQLRAGVDLILKQMEEALRSLNVQSVETVGTQFDPRLHEALSSVETPEYPDHQIVEEIRRGYRLRDRLLRPALVKIATNAAQRQA